MSHRLRVGALLCACGWSAAFAGLVGPELQRWLSRQGSQADTPVIVHLEDSLAAEALAVDDRSQRDNRLLRALQDRYARNRSAVQEILKSTTLNEPRDLWIINAVALTVSANRVREIAAHPYVLRVDLDAGAKGSRSQRAPGLRSSRAEADVATGDVPDTRPMPATAAWNIAAVGAPALWARGLTGKHVVIASMDSGVDPEHPLLRSQWRGGSNSWADVHGAWPTPVDALGHGTQTLGITLGRGGLGVAPDAQWIGVNLYDAQGSARMSDIHRAFQWLMDPDGDADTLDAPDVVVASWSLVGRAPGSCIREFETDIQVLQQAGIAVVFAAGNDGPREGSSSSPANNPGVMSVGAAERDGAIARQTSRGPSSCDRGIFPALLAPGMQIETTDLSYGGRPLTATVSGSSMAAPHVAGVLALLMQAFPSASLDQLTDALVSDDGGARATEPVALDGAAAWRRLNDRFKPAANTSSHTMRASTEPEH